jgi:hypothetical protein
MEITFKAHDGLCPYFIYGDIKFFIQDRKDTGGNWTYSLYSKSLKKEEVKTFMSHKEALIYVNSIKGVRKVGEHGGKMLFSNILSDYIINDKTVSVRRSARPLSGDFNKYSECLKFAKKYVADYIKMLEPRQLELIL